MNIREEIDSFAAPTDKPVLHWPKAAEYEEKITKQTEAS